MLHGDYMDWYLKENVYQTVHFLGVPCRKSYADLWNYGEIIARLRPSLVVEFGVRFGGSLLYYATMARLARDPVLAVGVDLTLEHVQPSIIAEPGISLMQCRTTDAAVAKYLAALRPAARAAFFSLDSDHSAENVLAELELLRPIVRKGDYVIVEDGWQGGPAQAMAAYHAKYPDDYQQDTAMEQRFGWTFAPGGYLVRK